MNQLSALVFCVLFSGIHYAMEAKTCAPPTNLHVTSYSSSTTKLNWNGGGASHWQIRYAPQNTSVWSAPLISLSDSSLALSGLQSNTYYTVVVRDSCGAGNVSNWTTLTYFKTGCPNITTPSIENFDGSAWLPQTISSQGHLDSCWARDKDYGLLIWTTGTFLDHTTGTGKYAELLHSGSNPGSASLETPLFDLSGITAPQMVFWNRMYGSNVADLDVYISKDSGTTYSLLSKIHNPPQFTSSAPWKELVIRLDSFANDVVRIKFEVNEQSQSYSFIGIDDFQIRPRPSCPRPENFELLHVGSYSATFDWDTLSAATWVMQYNTTGFSLGAGLNTLGSAIPAKLSNLQPGTAYDVYLRSVCSSTDKSSWIGPITFTTACDPIATPIFEDFESQVFTRSWHTMENIRIRARYASHSVQ